MISVVTAGRICLICLSFQIGVCGRQHQCHFLTFLFISYALFLLADFLLLALLTPPYSCSHSFAVIRSSSDMFRRQPASLPKDPVFPANLKALGYFVNDKDQIKAIKQPAGDYYYFITDNERYNEVYRESMHTCIRRIIWERLVKAGLGPLYLPSLTTVKPANSIPSLPIFTTPPSELREKQKVIIIFNKRAEDLGIWAYRRLSRDAGINKGSALSLISDALSISNEQDTPGIILTNPGPLLYTHRNDTVNDTPNLTPASWSALPRPSAVHPARRIGPHHNHVAGNATIHEHFNFILTRILPNPAFIHPDARLYLLGVADGGDELLELLHTHWRSNGLKDRVAALALTAPAPILACTSPFPLRFGAVGVQLGFLRFLRERVRAWSLGEWGLDTPMRNTMSQAELDDVVMNGSYKEPAQLWHAVCGHERLYAENVAVEAAGSVLEWFREVMLEDDAGRKYVHPEFVIPREVQAVLEEERLSREEDEGLDGWSDLESELGGGFEKLSI